MSNQLLLLVRPMEDIKGPARAVLNVLADRANENGESWPSWKTLQRESGFSRTTVHTALKELKRRGLVSWENRRGEDGNLTSNFYRLTIPSPKHGLGSSRDKLGDPEGGPGVVREADDGSPGDGWRSINEAPSGSTSEASLFPNEISPKAESISSKKNHLQELAESIYQEYPRKTAKTDALKSIMRAMKENDPSFLLERTKVYAKSIIWRDKQFIPYPATWFNKGMFHDNPEEWKQPTTTTTGSNPAPPVNMGYRQQNSGTNTGAFAENES